jgi:DNA-directed RNA polymerase subunit RPC12/RpoP
MKPKKPAPVPAPTVTREADEPLPGARIDCASCTPDAKAHAEEGRGLKCPQCSSYAVVQKKGQSGRYTCCRCGKTADFSGFVRIHR